ncbi:hypothetical protein JY96_21425 [Aquabacterium sp. NJ1]|nr:hypothetical protein JY96_21425 [Aquabacterium sp. NJ1]
MAMIAFVASTITMVAYDRVAVKPKLASLPRLAVIDVGAIYKAMQTRIADDVMAKNKSQGPEAAAKALAEGLDVRMAEKVGVYVEEVANTCDCVLLAKGGVMYGASTSQQMPDYTKVVMKKLGL